MGRTKKNASASVEVEAATEQAPQNSEAFSTRDVPSNKRVSLKLDDNGRIDFASMRDDTLNKFKSALAGDFSAQQKLGLVSGSVEMINPEQAKSIYRFLGPLEALAMERLKGVPHDIATKVFTYSEPELEALGKPTAKVINKYPSALVVKYKEEGELLLTLVGITQMKLAACRAMMRDRTSEPASAPAVENANSAAAVAHSEVESEASVHEYEPHTGFETVSR